MTKKNKKKNKKVKITKKEKAKDLNLFNSHVGNTFDKSSIIFHNVFKQTNVLRTFLNKIVKRKTSNINNSNNNNTRRRYILINKNGPLLIRKINSLVFLNNHKKLRMIYG